MTSKDKQLQTKIDEEIKKYNNLKNAFSTIYESEKDVQKKRQEVYEKISKIEEVDNSELSNIYKQFFAKMNELESFRTKHLKNINEKFLPMTVYYPEKLKQSKKIQIFKGREQLSLHVLAAVVRIRRLKK